ncbi:unnamed protein product [Trichobilharzia regenti]|nr:unnamed protein product [Trichobilharzia regenti]
MNTTITTTTTTTTTAITTNTVASTAATTVNTTPTANTTTLQSFIGRGSDVEMLQALQDFVQPDEVFIFPPISRLTLNFFVPIVEHSYRSLGLKRPKIHSIEKLSWSTPRIAPFINTITETILIIIIALTCFIIFPDSRLTVNTPGFYIILLIAFIIHTLLLVLFISDLAAWAWCPRRRDNNAKLLTKKSQNRNDWRRIVIRLYGRLFRWKSRNIIGVFILILPTALILSCYSYCLFTSYTSTSVIRKWNTIYSPLLYATYRTQIGLLFTFMFINCTLYTSFSSWTKTISATFVCLLGILLIGLHKVIQSTCSSRHIQSWYPVMLNNFNVSDTNQIPVSLSSSSSMSSPVYPLWLYTALSDSAISEYILIALLTLILVENIIPYYIMNDLRQHNKYSQHIEDAGVVFACIANFSEFYDEQYQGGQEMLRVLNEIFADFEHQLAAPKYKDVEKIKTIGACFMAASGLNMTERKRNKQPDEHLWALLDFALDLIHTLDDFNRQMFNFQFELKVGYNIGEVTAGVIGTTKLLYDIWGDTVNVASRMYSTGLKGRIQVAETVAKRLESRYIFEYRGEVFVKGKGDMKTYLLVSRRNDKRDSK